MDKKTLQNKTAKEIFEKTKGCIEIAYFEGKIGTKTKDYILRLLSCMFSSEYGVER